MIKIEYPTKSFLSPKEQNNVWYPYLLSGLQQIGDVRFTEQMSDLSNSERGDTITVFTVEIDSKKYLVYYDWCDFTVNHVDRCKENNGIYFKIQCDKNNPNMFPVGQTVTQMQFLNKLNELRDLKDQKKYHRDIIGLFRTTNLERRMKAVEIIKDMKNINSLVGLQKRAEKHEVPQNLIKQKIGYFQHLQEQCQTKLSLVLSGVGNKCAFSWRLTEALAMGCAIITHKHETIFPDHEWLENKCLITVKPDLSDLKDKISYYIKNDIKREEIAYMGRIYFDKYLSPKAMAKNILKNITK